MKQVNGVFPFFLWYNIFNLPVFTYEQFKYDIQLHHYQEITGCERDYLLVSDMSGG